MLRTCLTGIAILVAGTCAQAQGLIPTHKLSAALANELVGVRCAERVGDRVLFLQREPV